MPSRNILALALSISLAAPAAASAQSSAPATRPGLTADHFSVKAGLLFTSFSIDDDDSEAGGGGGLEIQGRYTRDRLSLAVGVERTVHDIEGVEDDLRHRVFYVEPRVTFPQLLAGSSQKALPYASARLGRSKYSFESNAEQDVEAGGWSYGLGGGVLFEMSPTTQLDLGLTWSHAGFGDAEVDGADWENSDFGANIVALRVGVSYRFGVGASRSSSAGKR